MNVEALIVALGICIGALFCAGEYHGVKVTEARMSYWDYMILCDNLCLVPKYE